MKWFKHFSDANTDDKLVAIRARFGLWGVGAYWTLCELLCAQLKPKDVRAEASFRLCELASSFGCKKNKLKSFLEHLRNIQGINFTLETDLVRIEIPRLLKSLDNYTKNLQVSGKSSTSISTSGLVVGKRNEREELMLETIRRAHEEELRQRSNGEEDKVF
jgi:hypothetical protein